MITIYFILVKPAVAGNIGAAARAMKTMGFFKLRLVNPCDHLSQEARMLAHASNEILENAEVFTNLKDAVKDIDFIIGTTARKRTIRNKFTPSCELPDIITSKGDTVRNIALVFGSEESGLSNEDANTCHLLSTISMATRYPSLNLAQAIMVYSYDLSVLSGKRKRKVEPKQNTDSWLVLRKRTEKILDTINMSESDLIRIKLMERLSILEEKDIYLLHSVTSKLISKIGNNLKNNSSSS